MSVALAVTDPAWISCPACVRPVRLTDAELAAGRGFCARCDARFELGPQARVGDGPGRELVHRSVALTVARPPGRHVIVRQQSPLHVELVSARPRLGALAAIGAGLGALTLVAYWVISSSQWTSVAGLFFLAAKGGPWWLRRWLPVSQRACIEDGVLIVEGGRSTQTLQLGTGRVDVAVSSDGLVVTSDHGSAVIGDGLHLAREDLTWLRGAVRAAAYEPVPGPRDDDPDRHG